ncbi:trp-like ion channel pkd2 [Gigaspora margarita]|uniref:Trp-like ion channel pkd2 n=1 Tax=Gigaspora margarita TaxID=4874 RepID=A0A8H4AJ50_GIGMA|nr:trp-like ion channel pkd2 [Gigaspora margarita]
MLKIFYVHLCLYFIIALSFYAVQVATNPVQQPVVEKRQSSNTITVPVGSTSKIPTYNVMNCGGSLDITNFEIFIMNVAAGSSKISFLIDINTSMNLDGIKVNARSYINSVKGIGEAYRVLPDVTCYNEHSKGLAANPNMGDCTFVKTQPTVRINSTYTLSAILSDYYYNVRNSTIYISYNSNFGCKSVSFIPVPPGTLGSPANLSLFYDAPLASLYNASLVAAISFVVLSYLISKAGFVKSGSADKFLPDAYDYGLSTSVNGHDHRKYKSETGHDNIAATDGTKKSCGCAPRIADITSAPSIYDIFRAAQFFVTAALISIPNLSEFYRDLASKFSWLFGLPNSFNLSYLANIADNGIRVAICKTCYDKSSSNDFCGQNSTTEFNNFAEKISVPSYDLFFLVFIVFLSALVLAICITLLIWVFARFSVCLYNKWKILQMIAANCLYFVLGGMLRVLILFYYPLTLLACYQLYNYNNCLLLLILAGICIAVFSHGIMTICGVKILSDLYKNDSDLFKKSNHSYIYGALYTQYKEDSVIKNSRIWFFIVMVSYDFSRAVITGLAPNYKIIQSAGLTATELILLILFCYFKPFKTGLMNGLHICTSVLRLLVSLLLIIFIFVHIEPLEVLICVLHFILIFLIFFVIMLQLFTTIRNSFCKKKEIENEKNENND